MTVLRGSPVLTQPYGCDACHHYKHTMGITFRPESIPSQHVPHCSPNDSSDGIRHEMDPTSQQDIQG